MGTDEAQIRRQRRMMETVMTTTATTTNGAATTPKAAGNGAGLMVEFSGRRESGWRAEVTLRA
jgi:hypothetical protein